MRKRVLLISTVHPPTDPRILYKIVPDLQTRYDVYYALPHALPDHGPATSIRLPRFASVLIRCLFTHPLIVFHCLRIRPSIIHIFVPELIPFALFFRMIGIPVVYEIQENYFKKFSWKKQNNTAAFRFLFRLFDGLARRYFYCIMTDKAYGREYTNLALPSAVIYNYVSVSMIDAYLHFFKPPVSPHPTFIYCGVISFERCFDVLIEALYLLKSAGIECSVLLFGPRRFSDQEAEALPHFSLVKPQLHFFGYTDLKNVIPYTRHAIAGIALLKPIGDYPDSYTTKLFEYMAASLPVITSDFLLYKKVVEQYHCGFCIPPTASTELAVTLKWCIEHPSARKILGLNGRKAAQTHFNWDTEGRKLLNYYENSLNHHYEKRLFKNSI